MSSCDRSMVGRHDMNLPGYEVIHYGKVKHIKAFIASITYRGFHMHSAWELGLLIKGKACIQTKHKEEIMEEGDIAIINPNQVHAIKAIGAPTILVYIQFSSNFCCEYIPLLSKTELQDILLSPHFTGEELEKIRHRFCQTAYAFLAETEHYNLKCVGNICVMMYAILQQLKSRTIDSAEYTFQKRKTERINRITSYMEEHYYESLHLRDLAQLENVTTTYLSHFFHENMNMTFQEYLNSIRLDRALQLVPDLTLKANDICEACGISDSRFLNKLLSNRYGYNLKQYRERMAWDAKVRQNVNYVPTVYEDCFFVADDEAQAMLRDYCERNGYFKRLL